MAKKQSRRSISVRGATYPLARLHAASRGKSLSDWLEFWIARGMESEGAIPPPPARRGGPKPAPRTLTSGAQAAAEIARLGAELAKAQEQIDYLRGALAVEAERFKKAEREYIEADHRTGLMVGDTRRERDAEKVRADREWNAAIEAANSVVGRLSGNNAALVAAGAAIPFRLLVVGPYVECSFGGEVVLATAHAALLSARTRGTESPETIRRMMSRE